MSFIVYNSSQFNYLFVVLFADSHALYFQPKHDNNNKTNVNKINHKLEIEK